MADKKPKLYAKLMKAYPEYIAAVESLGNAVARAGPLDDKSIQLIQLAAAAASRSEGAVHSHARRAQRAGASAAEIHHALIALTSTIGFPKVTAALSWVDDLLDRSAPDDDGDAPRLT